MRKLGSLLFLLLLSLSKSSVLAKVHARVINKLGCGRSMNLHCQSRDNDLGYHIIPDGFEMEWKFSVNFWGTTLFYCDVQWDNSSRWHHFDAYSYERDLDRCQTECSWMISEDGRLFGFNQKFGNWYLMPFQDGP